MKFGNDRLITEPTLRAPLKGRRIALLAHPASVTPDLTHSLDALAACGDMRITAAFGPQHGLRGDKQDKTRRGFRARDARAREGFHVTSWMERERRIYLRKGKKPDSPLSKTDTMRGDRFAADC